MIRKIGTHTAIAALSLLILLLASCGPRSAEAFAEKIIEKAAARAGEDIDIDLSDESVSFTDGEGNSFSLGGSKLPEGWPDSIPLEQTIEVLGGSASEEDGKKAWNLTARYPGSTTELYDFYKKEFADWQISSDRVMESADAKSYALQAAKDSYVVTLMVTSAGSGTVLVVGVAQQ